MPIGNYFKPEEFQCGCGMSKCGAPQMDMTLVLKLNGLRREFGEAMHLNSASRCPAWNLKCGGAKDSFHLKGMAVDVRAPNGDYMRRLIVLALKHGFTIGIMKHAVHLDTRPGPPIVFGY